MQPVTWMLQLYPRAWRERYATEMIALLEQHSITLWTAIDLLFGALDARLDPYYRRERLLIPHLPWRGLQSSWNVMITAFATFWLTQILWVSGGASWGPLSFSWPATDLTLLPGILAYLSLPIILTALVGWIGWQGGKNAWHLLRLLPVLLFIQLLLFAPWLDGWQNAALWLVLLVSLALTASSLGSMLTTLQHWEKRVSLALALCLRLLAFALIVGMGVLCFANISWMHMFWNSAWNSAFSAYWWYGPVTLTLELGTMLLSTVVALIALVRNLFELKALYKQGAPFSRARALSNQPPEAEAVADPVPEALPKTRAHPLIWLIISPILLGVFLISLILIANFTYAFDTPVSDSLVGTFLLSSFLASILIAFVISRGPRNKKGIDQASSRIFFQTMQVARGRN